jgi:hypothetical protein
MNSFRAIAAEVERRHVEDGDEIGKPIDHLLTLSQFLGIVKVGLIDNPSQAIRFGEFRDDFVHLLADLLVSYESDHVGKTTALGHVEEVSFLARSFVGNIFHEQQDQYESLYCEASIPPRSSSQLFHSELYSSLFLIAIDYCLSFRLSTRSKL